MDAAVVASLVTAGAALMASLVSGLFTYSRDARLKKLEERLDIQKSEHAAFLEYRYEARKRLYAELLPLMFILVEQCEDAYWRVHGIARHAAEGRLDDSRFPQIVVERNHKNEHIHKDSQNHHAHDYLISTIYRLIAPCVTVRLCQDYLTSTDLSADKYVAQVYSLARLLRRTWNGADEIARLEKNPLDAKEIHKQTVNLREVDLLVEALISRPRGQRPSIRSYSDVIKLYADAESDLYGHLRPFMEVFSGFRPDAKRLLWRVLLAQATICAPLMRANDLLDAEDHFPALSAVSELDAGLFNWRHMDDENAPLPEDVREATKIAHEYVSDFVKHHERPAAPVTPTSRPSWIARPWRRAP